MSGFKVQPPFPVFTNVDGTPLENGYVYIGEAGLNAESNPVSVYFDEDLTIPAAQPLRTTNGYIFNNGSPAKLYVEKSESSIIVKDKNGSHVFSELSDIANQEKTLETITPFQSSVGFSNGTLISTNLALTAPTNSLNIKIEIRGQTVTNALPISVSINCRYNTLANFLSSSAISTGYYFNQDIKLLKLSDNTLAIWFPFIEAHQNFSVYVTGDTGQQAIPQNAVTSITNAAEPASVQSVSITPVQITGVGRNFVNYNAVSNRSSGDRRTGVTYTNTTNFTRFVMVYSQVDPDLGYTCFGYVDSVLCAYGSHSAFSTGIEYDWVNFTLVVPPGSTYRVDSNTTAYWREVQ